MCNCKCFSEISFQKFLWKGTWKKWVARTIMIYFLTKLLYRAWFYVVNWSYMFIYFLLDQKKSFKIFFKGIKPQGWLECDEVFSGQELSTGCRGWPTPPREEWDGGVGSFPTLFPKHPEPVAQEGEGRVLLEKLNSPREWPLGDAVWNSPTKNTCLLPRVPTVMWLAHGAELCPAHRWASGMVRCLRKALTQEKKSKIQANWSK